MDMDLLKADLETAFSELPREVLRDLSHLVLSHKDVFATKLPILFERIFPHVKAGMMEFALGILEVKAVEDAIMEVLSRHGVQPAIRPPETTLSDVIARNPNRPPGL